MGQKTDMDFLCEMVLNVDIAMSVVAGIAILAGYTASLFFTAGATAVYGVAMNDCRRGEVSSTGRYVITGGIKALEGAVAGAAICMAPGYAAGKISSMFPGGVSILNLIIPAERLAKIAMADAHCFICQRHSQGQ